MRKERQAMVKSAVVPSPAHVRDETGSPASHADYPNYGRDVSASEHFVQFYENEAILIQSLGTYIGAGLGAGEGAIVIATDSHRVSLEKQLWAQGIDIMGVKERGQYIALDAAETLTRFMVEGLPDEKKFFDLMGDVIARAENGRRRVRAFGEMVALLWGDGNAQAVSQLENLWNRLGTVHGFSLFCAYPMEAFGNAANGDAFAHICEAHSRVVPAESFSASFGSEDDRSRAIALLQQKAASLGREIAERKRAETGLRRRSRELTAFVETAAVGLHWVAPNGTILWANAAEMEMLGYSAEEYIGHSISEFHAVPGTFDRMMAYLNSGEKLRDFETKLRCKDGSTRDVLIDSSVLWEDGQFVHTQCFTRDVTGRNRTEQALAKTVREQSALYRFVERRHRAKSFDDIHQAALDAILAALQCDRAAILLCDGAKVMRFAASRGLSDAYRKAVEGHSPWDVEDANPQPLCLPDVSTADLDESLKAVVRREGIAALAFTPVVIHGRLGGKFMTYYDSPHAFSQDELELGLSIARQLALGIERKRAEEELRSREQHIRQLLSLMPAAVYTCGAQGQITFFNRRAAELWGREPQLMDQDMKFCGAFRLWRTDGSLMPHSATPMALAVETGESTRNGEVTIERPDGSRVVVNVNVDPLYNVSGERCGAINVFQDITERKAMEDALRGSQREEEARRMELATQYRISRILVESASVQEAAPAVLQAICEDAGWEIGALWLSDVESGRLQCVDLWHRPDVVAPEFVDASRHGTFSSGAGSPGRVWASGEPLWIENLLEDGNFRRAPIASRAGLRTTVAFPLRIENRAIGVMEFFSRKTRPADAEFLQRANAVGNQIGQFIERKRAEEAIRKAKDELETRVRERTASLQEAVGQMEEFSYTVSHDLRAPVRAMHGYASIVLEDYGDRLDDCGREYLDRIVRGGERMDHLIQDILTYSRLSRREVQLQPVSLDKLVREIVQQYPDMQPPACAIHIVAELDDVIGHEPSLTQAISNLLSNATKFVSPHTTPKVRIRTERRDGQVRLWVEDNGIGIRPEHQHRLFGLFERIHPERRYEGTGIGLAIVRKAVERMGGRVGLESDGLTGSSFWIALPAAPSR